MENEHNDIPQNNNWLDDILGVDTPSDKVSADELAVSAAGLTHLEDVELEEILAADWGQDEPEPEPAPAPVEPEPAAEEIPEPAVEEPTPAAEPAQPTPKEKKPAAGKGRPKAKKGYGLLGIPHILATLVWLAIIVAVGVSLGRLLWVCCSDLMAFGKEPQSVTITVTEEDDIDSISQKLGNAGLVRYPGLFKMFAQLTGKDAYIDPGTYTLNSQLDYNAMINGMVDYGPARESVTLMFPEGYNCAQIFAILEENGVCTVAELEQWAATGELSEYWFLEDVVRGDKYCLEGYLAPDTYDFYVDDEPQRVLEKFLDEFDDRFTEKMKEQFADMQQRYANMLSANGYDSSYIAANKLTLHQVITLASIVQKETSNYSECYDIASVFYNRLANPSSYPYLDSDATVYYAIGDYFGEKEDLTSADLASSSPYNTRNHKGLPPGPICNPGTDSLYAALEPSQTGYYYFVYSENDKKHLFSSTYDAHKRLLEELGLA